MSEKKEKSWTGRAGRLLVLMVAIFLSFLFVTEKNVAHADILKLPRLSVISDGNVTIGSKYTFVPEFTSRSKVETWGSNVWRDTRWSGSDSRGFRSIDVTHPVNRDSTHKGKIGVTYTNVGYYDGQSIDLRITVTNWSRFGLPGKVGKAGRVGHISFEKNKIAMATTGFNWVDTTWEYVKSGTRTRVPVSGYFTFSDVDIRQGLQFSATTSRNIDRFLIQSRNNNLKYRNVSGQYRIYDTTNVDIKDTTYNHRHAFTMLYSDMSSFGIRWMTDWPNSPRFGKPMTPERYFYTNIEDYSQGEYLFYVKNKPAPTTVPKPKKTVNKTTNVKVGDTITHTVKHTVPAEDSRFHYKSYVITDVMDDALRNTKVSIKNEAGSTVTGWFTTSTKGNTVTITAKKDRINKAAFYGDTYTITYTSSVDKNKLKAAAGTKASHLIKNEATVKVDGTNYVSNEVSSRAYNRTLTVRHVDKQTNKEIASNSEKLLDGESYSVSPRTNLKSGSDKYIPTTTKAKTGTIDGKNVTETFYYELPRTLTIEHIDYDTNEVIKTDTRKLYDGEKYSEKPRTDLKKNGESYKPRSTSAQSGTINGKNETIKFYYTLPRTLTIEHIDYDSGKVIKKDTKRLHDGVKYSEKSRTDLKLNGETYKPRSAKAQAGTINGKDVTIKFYYTLPRTFTVMHIDYDSGNVITQSSKRLHDGTAYNESPRTDLKHANGDSYQPRSIAAQKGTINGKDVTLKFYYTLPREITVNHIDDETGDIILKEETKLHDGKTYSYASKLNLQRDDGYTYKPRSLDVITGTVDGEDVTINIYYFVPKIELGIDLIEIFTSRASSSGLPTNVKFTRDLADNGSILGDFVGTTMEFKVRDTTNGRTVINETVAVEDMADVLDLVLRTDYLGINQKINYTYTLEVDANGDNNYEVVSSTPSVETHGYTSLETVLSNSDLADDKISITGVIKTEKKPSANVTERKESLAVTLPTLPKQKTGYGIEPMVSAVYTNDLKNTEPVNTTFGIQEAMIDSYLDYPTDAGMTNIKMDETEATVTAGGKTRTTKLQLPEVNVEAKTGYLFTNEQVAASDDRITEDLHDGGRKLYIPIWTDVGTYNYTFSSTAPIGVNHVSFDIAHVLNVYAYMFNHEASETPDDDEFLIHPMEQDEIEANW